MKRSGIALARRSGADGGFQVANAHGMQGPRYAAKDGWSRQWADHPAMPGVGPDHFVGKDVTSKNKWFDEARVPHGGVHVYVGKKQTSYFDGPPGVSDSMDNAVGEPQAYKSHEAARWKVEMFGRVDPDYRVENAPVATATNKPRPRTIPCSSSSSSSSFGRPSMWRNLLSKIEGSVPDSLLRNDVRDVQNFAPSLEEDVAARAEKGQREGAAMRSKLPQRPWDTNKDAEKHVEEQEPIQLGHSTAAFGEAMNIPATAMWMFAWVNEWETQVKIACPWDKKLVVHRCTAELPWVLEQQWNSPEAAQELVKDCIEDFHEMAKKKGYTTDKISMVVHVNGFWSQRRGVIMGLNEMRNLVTYESVADITPIPVHETELLFPTPASAPKVATFSRRVSAEDGYESFLGGSVKY